MNRLMGSSTISKPLQNLFTTQVRRLCSSGTARQSFAREHPYLCCLTAIACTGIATSGISYMNPRIVYQPIDEKAAKALDARPRAQEQAKTEEFLIKKALYNASSLMCDAVRRLEQYGQKSVACYKLESELQMFNDTYHEAHETNNLEMKKLAIELAYPALKKAVSAMKENQEDKKISKEYITEFEGRIEKEFKEICELIKKNTNQD